MAMPPIHQFTLVTDALIVRVAGIKHSLVSIFRVSEDLILGLESYTPLKYRLRRVDLHDTPKSCV
jgi:hypothetical protein